MWSNSLGDGTVFIVEEAKNGFTIKQINQQDNTDNREECKRINSISGHQVKYAEPFNKISGWLEVLRKFRERIKRLKSILVLRVSLKKFYISIF